MSLPDHKNMTYTFFTGPERYTQPHSVSINNVRSYHHDLDEIRKVYGRIPLDDNGKIILLENGDTDITNASGISLIEARHGVLSRDARTPGREKFVFYDKDFIGMGNILRGYHPHRSVDSETGLKVWTWVVERPWVHPVTQEKGLRQVVYVAKQDWNEPRVGMLENIYIPEDGEELPLSEPTPNEFVFFWRELTRPFRWLASLFKGKS